MRSKVERHSEEAEKAVRDIRRGDPPAVRSGGKGPDRDCGSARRGQHR
jgi:hypothetical protein